MRPLYGIAEAGAYWWLTYFKHHCEELEIKKSTYNPCLLIFKPNSGNFGVVAMQTNNTLRVNNIAFAKKKAKKMKFLAKKRQNLITNGCLIFNGCILTVTDTILRLKQKNQGLKFETATDRASYIQQRARGAYIATTCQPMASFNLSVVAQIFDPTSENVAKFNKRIKWQKDNVNLGFDFIPIDLNIIKLFIIINASFANNKNLTLQLGYIIILGNKTATNELFTVEGNIVH
jgi:hypothetical protein